MSELRMTPEGLDSGRGGPAQLEESFHAFVDAMVRVGGPAYGIEHMLNPGRSADEVRHLLEEENLAAPPEIVAYWTLHNGHRSDTTAVPPPDIWWYPVGLELAFRLHGERKIGWDPTEPMVDWQNPGWLEITADHSLVARLDPDQSGRSPVRALRTEEWEFGEESNQHQLASICTIFDVGTLALDDGAFRPTTLDDGWHTWERLIPYAEWRQFTHGVQLLG
jgi:hypothetical protein